MSSARNVLSAAAMAALLAAPSASWADLRGAQHAGSTCNTYPPYRNDVGVAYQHWLYGFSQGAFCPIRIDDERPAKDIYLVWVYGLNISVRLCLHRHGQWIECGPSKTLGSSARTFTYVWPPSVTPGEPTGAFLSVRFPGGVSLVDEFSGLWSVP